MHPLPNSVHPVSLVLLPAGENPVSRSAAAVDVELIRGRGLGVLTADSPRK